MKKLLFLIGLAIFIAVNSFVLIRPQEPKVTLPFVANQALAESESGNNIWMPMPMHYNDHTASNCVCCEDENGNENGLEKECYSHVWTTELRCLPGGSQSCTPVGPTTHSEFMYCTDCM
jgi:hypothetical protein